MSPVPARRRTASVRSTLRAVGFLDRVVRIVNRVGDPAQDLTTVVDPRLRRMDEVVGRGEQLVGRIVGIQRRHVDDASRTVLLVDVPGSPTGDAQRFATEITTTRHLHRLRLGLDVPVRVVGGKGAVDWPALAAACGLVGSEPGQRSHRRLPEEGIDDRDHTNATLKLLERGVRGTATIAELDRVHVLGMPTVNWHVRLVLDDGSSVERRTEEVPPYAWWYTAPGVQVTVAVDESDPSRVAVDWAALATAHAATARLDEVPPAGTLAAEVEAAAAGETAAGTASAGTDVRKTIAATRDLGHVNATLQSWVDEVLAGRMKPKAFLSSVRDWEAAGMCTAAEAAAARSAAGLGG